MRWIVFLLAPAFANAGVVYDVSARLLVPPGRPPIVIRYFVRGDEIRTEATGNKSGYLVKDEALLLLNSSARSVQTLPHMTLEDVHRKMEDSVKQIEARTAKEPPNQRRISDQALAMMKKDADSMGQPLPWDYRMTGRSESIGGYSCNVWEAYDHGTKQLELCIAQVSAIPGGQEILRGMKSMLRYVHGSILAIGVEFGRFDGWPGIKRLGGVPLHIRQFQAGTPMTDIQLTGMHQTTLDDSLFEVPAGYSAQSPATGTRPTASSAK